ncbi:MAG: hypothetical protein AB7N76_20335 [Planctomycetota bacterium]
MLSSIPSSFLRAPLLLLLLCAAPVAAQEAPPAVRQETGFPGHWETTFGELVLTQDGVLLRGSYGQGGAASLRGTLEGEKLSFRYEETGERGQGWFELAADGQSFAGQWRADGGEEWKAWTGKRLPGPPRAGFTGVFETSAGRVRLAQQGDAVRGVYCYGGNWGRLEGKVRDGALRFEWREGESKGEGEFKLGAQQVQLRGRWRSAGEQEWKDWNGQRVQARPGVRWLMVLEAYWEEGLEQSEYSFGSMLGAYFRRYPRVQLRHRRYGDKAGLLRYAREVALLAEPVVLVIASHGEQGALVAGEERVSADELAGVLAELPNLALLHFSACEVLVGEVPKQLRAGLPKGQQLPLSGYATAVDWSASAVLEFLYFDLILGRGFSPARAAQVVRQELGCASDRGVSGSPLGGLKFRFFE